MANVTVNGSASGSDIVLSADEVFSVTAGKIEYSTDAGTTYISFSVNDPPVVFVSGLTVKVKNSQQKPATFSHMPF